LTVQQAASFRTLSQQGTNDMITTILDLKNVAAAILMGVALFFFGHAEAAEVRNIDVVQSQTMAHGGALLLDVREPHEFSEAHAPGSVLIPLGQLEKRLAEIRSHANQPIVIICRSGSRSARAASVLNKLGFTSVHNVSGGMIAWRAAGLPVVTPGK
jgi:rhodanese-related sulfurtransferase